MFTIEALTGKHLVFTLPRPLLTIIIMIIVELTGRRRQIPSVLAGEGEIFSTKDILSCGSVDTH